MENLVKSNKGITGNSKCSCGGTYCSLLEADAIRPWSISETEGPEDGRPS